MIAVGWAAIFIRLADAPALSTAAWRLVFGSVPLAALALVARRDELVRLSRREQVTLTISGVALALHFATWVASLKLTTVASSVALVTTQPIWVALLAAALLGERVSGRAARAIGVATLGGVLIAGADIAVTGRALAGDLLAVAGAVFAAVYFIAGRRVRPSMSLLTYTSVVYGIAAVVLVAVTAGTGQPLTGFSMRTWVMLALMALVAQIVGHSLLNWSLRYLSAPLVSIAILGEPIVSSVLAIPILGEWPGPLRVLGGAVTLVGVYLAVRETAAAARVAAESAAGQHAPAIAIE